MWQPFIMYVMYVQLAPDAASITLSPQVVDPLFKFAFHQNHAASLGRGQKGEEAGGSGDRYSAVVECRPQMPPAVLVTIMLHVSSRAEQHSTPRHRVLYPGPRVGTANMQPQVAA